MPLIEIEKNDGVATLTLARGKVNAINAELMYELGGVLDGLKREPETRVLVLTGRGKFFSFGFDVPQILTFSRDEFTRYATSFTNLYRELFLYPKPVIASLNGHTVAGGCMVALTCDTRIMVSGNARISLNEINFGSSVFAGSTEMLRFLIGGANTSEVLYSGAMYSAEEAKALGLVQVISIEDELENETRRIATDFAVKDPIAFASIKSLLRKEVGEAMSRRDTESVAEMVEIWFSETTRTKLRNILIHE